MGCGASKTFKVQINDFTKISDNRPNPGVIINQINENDNSPEYKITVKHSFSKKTTNITAKLEQFEKSKSTNLFKIKNNIMEKTPKVFHNESTRADPVTQNYLKKFKDGEISPINLEIPLNAPRDSITANDTVRNEQHKNNKRNKLFPIKRDLSENVLKKSSNIIIIRPKQTIEGEEDIEAIDADTVIERGSNKGMMDNSRQMSFSQTNRSSFRRKNIGSLKGSSISNSGSPTKSPSKLDPYKKLLLQQKKTKVFSVTNSHRNSVNDHGNGDNKSNANIDNGDSGKDNNAYSYGKIQGSVNSSNIHQYNDNSTYNMQKSLNKQSFDDGLTKSSLSHTSQKFLKAYFTGSLIGFNRGHLHRNKKIVIEADVEEITKDVIVNNDNQSLNFISPIYHIDYNQYSHYNPRLNRYKRQEYNGSPNNNTIEQLGNNNALPNLSEQMVSSQYSYSYKSIKPKGSSNNSGNASMMNTDIINTNPHIQYNDSENTNNNTNNDDMLASRSTIANNKMITYPKQRSSTRMSNFHPRDSINKAQEVFN